MDKVFLFESVQHHDNRGFFMRSFCHDTLELHGLESKIFQINISHNISEHTFRGYHYQSEPQKYQLMAFVLLNLQYNRFLKHQNQTQQDE